VFLEKAATMSLLFRDGTNLVLMDDETFEQLEVAEAVVDAPQRRFLADGMKLQVGAHVLPVARGPPVPMATHHSFLMLLLFCCC
jgi:hypothetical protein